MRRGGLFIYVFMVLGMFLPARAALASELDAIGRGAGWNADIGDVMLLENPSMFGEEVVVELNEEDRDENGFHYWITDGKDCYAQISGNCNLRYNTGLLEIRIPDKVIKNGVEYKVTKVNCPVIRNSLDNTMIKVKFYVGKYTETLQCGTSCEFSSFFVHPENEFLVAEKGSLFDYKKETLIKLYDGVYSSADTYHLPPSVRAIGEYAFRNTRLREVVLGSEVTKISNNAFWNAEIQRIDLNQVKTVGAQAFYNCESLRELVISEEGVSLGSWCFCRCDNLKSVYLPANTQLACECFSSCRKLEIVIMENGCTFADPSQAFKECLNLRTLILPETLNTLCWNIVDECNVLEKLYLPPSIRQIEERGSNSSYQYAKTFYCVDPENVRTEHPEQHENVKIASLAEHVHCWKNVTFLAAGEMVVVGNYCPDCGRAKDIERTAWQAEGLPPSLKSSWQEYSKGPDCLELDDTMTDEYGLRYELDAESRTATIVKAKGVKYHNYYWRPPSTVKRKGVIYTVENIGEYVFYGYALIMPDTIKELNTWSMPNGVELLVVGVGVKAFLGYDGLSKVGRIVVSEDNPYFCSENNVLYNKDKTELIVVGEYGIDEGTVFTVPPSVKEIGQKVRFEKGLEKVRIYNREDMYIDDEVYFAKGIEIEYLEWGEPLDENNTDADGRTYVLDQEHKTAVFVPRDLSVYGGKELTTPYKVEKDGIYYVVDGIDFEQVTVPNTEKLVLKINKHISSIDFGMRALNKIYCEVNWENTHFRQLRGSLLSASRDTIYHFYDEPQETIYHLPLQVEKIGAGAFRGANISNVCGGEQLISIGAEAFTGCRYLEEIKLQKTGLNIGDRAFAECVSLKNIYLPPNTTIGDSVFKNCQSLAMVILDQGTEWGVSGSNGLPAGTKCYDYLSVDGHEHSFCEATFFCCAEWGVKGMYCRECDDGIAYEVVTFLTEENRDEMPKSLETIITESTLKPTEEPTESPTKSPAPSAAPTEEPTECPTESPAPSAAPTEEPTEHPTESPAPSAAPTEEPTESPTESPAPSAAPTKEPTEHPTKSPAPSAVPTEEPTEHPTESPAPSAGPTEKPTEHPTESPAPSVVPTQNPAQSPTENPVQGSIESPTGTPSAVPIPSPTKNPTQRPTAYPAESPSMTPAEYPTETPGSVKIESSTQSPITVETKKPVGMTDGDDGNLLLQYRQSLRITGFRVSGAKHKGVKLSWNRNSYAKGYQIYRAVSKAGSYKLVKMVDQACTDYVDTEIMAKKKYFYKIKAIGVFGSTLLEGEESRTRSYYNAGIFTPRISVKKGRSGAVRYILVELRYYEENRVEIYISQNTKKYKKLKLVSNKITRYKGRFKIKYTVKSQNIRFKVRTYKQVGKRRIYSKFSKEVKVRV